MATGEADTSQLNEEGLAELESTNRGAQVFANFERDLRAEIAAAEVARKYDDMNHDIDDGC